MSNGTSQFDYPVDLGDGHRAAESVNYDGDKFDCMVKKAYTHTGAWPTWSYCPYCGGELDQ